MVTGLTRAAYAMTSAGVRLRVQNRNVKPPTNSNWFEYWESPTR